jgi:hypothetical protein
VEALITRIIRKALTRRVVEAAEGPGRRVRVREEPPGERLVLSVAFTMGAITVLAALEAIHVVWLGSWSSEIFAAITGLIGTVTGILAGRQ